MTMVKTLFLDSYAIINTIRNPLLSKRVIAFLCDQGYTLIVNVVSLIEINQYDTSWWDAIAELLTAVPFRLAENIENVFAAEVQAYPQEIALPFNYATDKPLNADVRREVTNDVRRRIGIFAQDYKNDRTAFLESAKLNQSIWNSGRKLPETDLFIYTNSIILGELLHSYNDFLVQHSSIGIDIKCFKSLYVPALAMFYEYYRNKKTPGVSDIGDFYHLGYVPYVDVSVIDNERHALAQQINRANELPWKLSTKNWAQFLAMLG